MPHCPACHREFARPAGAGIPYACPECHSLVVGHYCDLNLIGGGAMGDVYRARRPDMGNRTVAIKIPKAVEPQVCRRFEREIAASARLRHENIVCAFDRGEEEGWPYLVMEYVAGQPLAEIVDAEHPLSPARVARVLMQVAAGLAHASSQRIVNRDIKPDNILIATADGGAKILDYGLGLIAALDGSAERVTRTGTLLGTPSFLAPEQARDPRGVTIAADVYALGCTAYYVLTQRTPFKASDSQEIQRMHAESRRPSVRDIRPDVPEEFDALIQQMMAVAPDRRPAPKELTRRIEQMLPRLSDARPPIASSTIQGMIDVICPACGEVYHLRTTSVGKQMTCKKNLCRHRFTVGPQVAATQSMARDDVRVITAEAVEAEALDAEVVDAEVVDAEAVEAVTIDAEAVDGQLAPSLATGVELVPVEPVEAEAVDAVAVGAETVVAEPVVAGAAEPVEVPPLVETVAVTAAQIDTPLDESIAVLPASAIVSTVPSAQTTSPVQKPAAPARPAKQMTRRQRRARWVTASVTAAILIMGGVGIGLLLAFREEDSPEKHWQQAQEIYLERKWNRAQKEFEKFLADYPDDPHAKEIPYFLAMCEAGDDIFSDTGNVERGLANAEEIFKEHRDTEVYNLYATDLHKALARLIERLSEHAVKSNHPAKIESARRAESLLLTVAQAMSDDWVPGENGRLSKLIGDAEQKVRLLLTRQEVLAQLQRANTSEPLPDVDDLYAQVEQLLQEHRSLAADKEIAALRDSAYRAEAARVRYIPFESGDTENSPPSEVVDSSHYVVWDNRASAEHREAGDRVVMALARGVLYVFDPKGNFLWARRLGIDTHRLPGRIEATATSPAALVAVSSEDNTLLALEARTGRVLWRYAVGGDIVAPLTLVTIRGGPNAPDKTRGLLPITSLAGSGGEIHVLEMVLGKRLGHFDVGHPMSVGGTYDPSTKLIYFPADSKRVFAINPAAIDQSDAPACRSVLLTGHAAGSLRSAPSVVGQYDRGQEYLILAEASELEQMKLRAFELKDSGFSDPRAEPLKELTVRGWSWFGPRATPDRITLVTDEGDLGLFGLNLDNRDEALYRLVEDPSTWLRSSDRSRALAVHADEHLLWAIVGGRLQKFSLDLLKQKVRPLWTKESEQPAVSGMALHEAQMDRFGNTFYLATMSPGGDRFDLTAVDSVSGRTLWRRQLGTTPALDPLADAAHPGRLHLIDRSGGVVELNAGASTNSTQPPGSGTLPPGVDPRAIVDLAESAGIRRLAVPLDGGQLSLAEIDVAAPGGLSWQSFKLESPLSGRPAVVESAAQSHAGAVGSGAQAIGNGKFLVVPGANGLLRRMPLDPETTTLTNEVAFQWSDTIPPSGLSTADIYAAGENALLLIDGRRRLRRLEFRTSPVPQWEATDSAFQPAAAIEHNSLVYGKHAYCLTADSVLHELDILNPGREQRKWNVGGRVTSEPFLRGGKLLVVIDERKLVCIDPAADSSSEEPLWQSAPARGRIRGLPSLAGDVLLVADDSRRVVALSLSDGQPVWSQRITVRAGPAAAAVAYGKDRVLIPLTDGTLWTMPLPEKAQEPSQ